MGNRDTDTTARRRARPHRGQSEHGDPPVNLPVATLTVHADGTLTVSVDGTPVDPEPPDSPWQRQSVPAILDRLGELSTGALRLEIREADGTTFTDIITPSDHHHSRPPGGATPPTVTSPGTPHSGGFVPGEDVAIAVVIGHSRVRPDGTISNPPTALQATLAASGEVILLGRTSGAHTTRPRP